MAELLEPDRGTCNADPKLAHLKREIFEKKWTEARRWGREPDLQDEIQGAE